MGKFCCRFYQKVMKIGMYFLPYRKPVMIKGDNALNEIPAIFKNKNIEKVLIVTDNGIVKLGLHNNLLNILKTQNINYILYDKTVPNPTIDNIEEGYKLYKENKCEGIIALGGGSPMDCAKVIGARVVNPKKSVTKMRGLLKVKGPLPTLVAIPTTAGTGSETTLAAVVTDGVTHEKYAINDTDLIPHYAVLDASLTIFLPPMLTATTGMDALTHAVEAYIGKSNTKETRKCAEQAVKLIFDNLETAFVDGKNKDARNNMQEAAYLAGVAFTRAYVGNVHSIAHTLGGKYGVPHGLANSILLPIVLEYYGKAIYKSISKLCKKIGLFNDKLTDKEKTESFIEKIKNMNKSFGIGEKVDQLKVEDIDVLAKRAEKESNPLYPVPKIFNLEDFKNIYKKILK